MAGNDDEGWVDVVDTNMNLGGNDIRIRSLIVMFFGGSLSLFLSLRHSEHTWDSDEIISEAFWSSVFFSFRSFLL